MTRKEKRLERLRALLELAGVLDDRINLDNNPYSYWETEARKALISLEKMADNISVEGLDAVYRLVETVLGEVQGRDPNQPFAAGVQAVATAKNRR